MQTRIRAADLIHGQQITAHVQASPGAVPAGSVGLSIFVGGAALSMMLPAQAVAELASHLGAAARIAAEDEKRANEAKAAAATMQGRVVIFPEGVAP